MDDLTPQRLEELMRWICDLRQPPAAPGDRADVALDLFDRLFLRPPALTIDEPRRRAFETIVQEWFHRGPTVEIEYNAPYPKHEFFCYLVRERGYLIHGSTSLNLTSLTPREQQDWKGKPHKAIFAASDGIWPIFFAVLHPQLAACAIRNGCFVIDRGEGPACEERFYFFSLDHACRATARWERGMIYVVKRDGFEPNGRRPVYFDEWVGPERAPVIARVPVTPTDFPFLAQVAAHPADEPVEATWLHYRERLAAKGSMRPD